MKMKTIFNFVLTILLFSATILVGFYYLNSPTTKIAKQHIHDNSAAYIEIKDDLKKPYNVGKSNLGKFNLGVLDIMYKRVKPINKHIIIKFMIKEDQKKPLTLGKNQYDVLFGDTLTNDVFKDIHVIINVLNQDTGPDDINTNDETVDNENDNDDIENQCDEENDCDSDNTNNDDSLSFLDLIVKLENEGINANSLKKAIQLIRHIF